LTVVLDTNVVSAIMHRLPAALARLRASEPADVVLCTPVAAEIHYGLSRLARGSKRRLLLTEEFERIRQAVAWVDWTEPAALEFGRQKAMLESRGSPIDDMDVAIGSVALALGARVATYNARHLQRLEGLAIDDWTEAPRANPRS
jgi:predicted nucleic acid-binding protein